MHRSMSSTACFSSIFLFFSTASLMMGWKQQSTGEHQCKHLARTKHSPQSDRHTVQQKPANACYFFFFFCCPIILAELIDALLLCHWSRPPYLQPRLRLILHHGPAPYPRGPQNITAQSFGVSFALSAIVAKDGEVKQPRNQEKVTQS